MANLFRLPFVGERAYAEAEKREASLEDRLYAAAFFAEVAARSEEAVEAVRPLLVADFSESDLRAAFGALSSVAAEGGLPMPGK